MYFSFYGSVAIVGIGGYFDPVEVFTHSNRFGFIVRTAHQIYYLFVCFAHFRYP